MASPPAKKCIIVGGAFGGLACIHHLLATTRPDELELVLIEPRDYFEYTPGVLRAFVEPEHFQRISFKLSSLPSRVQHCQGWLHSINADSSTVIVQKETERFTLSYDFLVLGTGMPRYSEPGIYSQDTLLDERFENIKAQAELYKQSKSIIIVGSGAVGVELAGELVSKFSDTSVTLCYPRDVLMEFPEAARRMCREWLAAHSCILRPGIKVDVSSLTATATGQQVAIKNSKERLEADIIVLCLGSDGGTPEFITLSQGLTAMVDAHGRLPVNDQFQLLAHANIYVCGDCCSHPSVSTKTAQMANWGGIQVAQSIAQALAPTTLLTRARVAMRWPALLLRNPRSWPSLYVVSLGPHHGLLIVNGFVLPTAFGQRVASFAKDFIEASKVMESQGSWLGLVLWQLGDSAACMVDFLGL